MKTSQVPMMQAPACSRAAQLQAQGTIRDPYLHQLLVLNVMLQLFDGVATYSGVRLGWNEANPLLRSAFDALGLGPTLLLFKALACALLVLLYRTAPPTLSGYTLRALAAVYCVLSLGPWLAKFIALLSRHI